MQFSVVLGGKIRQNLVWCKLKVPGSRQLIPPTSHYLKLSFRSEKFSNSLKIGFALFSGQQYER